MSLRLDKWLWFARFAKTRSLAAKLCAEGFVTVDGVAVSKPNHPVQIGARLTIHRGSMIHSVTVLALGERRGPAPEARSLYAETEPPLRLREAEREAWRPLIDADG